MLPNRNCQSDRCNVVHQVNVEMFHNLVHTGHLPSDRHKGFYFENQTNSQYDLYRLFFSDLFG